MDALGIRHLFSQIGQPPANFGGFSTGKRTNSAFSFLFATWINCQRFKGRHICGVTLLWPCHRWMGRFDCTLPDIGEPAKAYLQTTAIPPTWRRAGGTGPSLFALRRRRWRRSGRVRGWGEVQ